MSMSYRSLTVAMLVFMAALAAAPQAFAQTTTIVAVVPVPADPTTQVDVFGTNFVVGGVGPSSVTIAGFPAAFAIAADGPVNDALTVNIPAAVLGLGPGTYQLRVSQSAAAGRTAIYEMTIQAVGPQGPAGPAGPAGPPGADGADGADGPAGSANISGTTNRLVKFTAPTTGGNSLLFDNGTNIGLGTVTPGFPMQIVGTNISRNLDVVNSSAAGDAIWGFNTAAAGTNAGAGVVGISSQANAQSAGVWGENPNANGTGVIGVANGTGSTVLPNGSGGAFSGNITGVFARSSTGGVGQAIYADQFGDVVRVAYWNGAQFFKINGTGTVSTHVKDPTDPAGERRITLHAPETPEIYFMDYGQGQLVNGRAHIDLDPRMAGSVLVDATHPLRVFIQVEDDEDVLGVVVKNKTANGFDVVEMRGGTSNAAFQWQIVANRADEVLDDGRVSRNADARFEESPNTRSRRTNPPDSGNASGGNGNANGGARRAQ